MKLLEFRRIIVDGIIGYISSIGLKALVFSNHEIYDKVLSEPLALDQKKVKRVAECQLILHPAALKYAYNFLGERLKEYEALYGQIPTNEEFESRRGICSLKVLMI